MKKYFHIFLFSLLMLALPSCFTGVEGTKKITLSKEDKKNIQPSAEELYFQPVAGVPLKEWEKGRPFIASDNKALLIFEQQGLPLDPDEINLGGKTLYYSGTETRMRPDGTEAAVILFTDGSRNYKYNSGKKNSEAPDDLLSDQIPMLIDEAMIDSARELLSGKQLWTRSPLWYDDNSERIKGQKFVPVTINAVEPGTLVFPVRLRFKTEDGTQAWMFMNFGNTGTDSRSFANLFYLSDIRKNYPAVTDEVWQLICDGKIREGMTKLECKLSLGNPSEVNAGHDYSQTLDLWNYPDGSVLWFEDGLLTKFRH